MILEPCQVVIDAWPRHVITVRTKANAMFIELNPVPSHTTGSNNRTFRWAERIAPKPRPSVQPYGAQALNPTVLERPSTNRTSEDSARAITSAIALIEIMF